jgi:hypothetical protein
MKKIFRYILVLASLALVCLQSGCYDSAGHILDINGNPVSGNLSAYPVSINGTFGSGNITIVSINGTLPITESDVVDLVADLAGKEPTITAGTISQYWRGDKTWQNLNSAITALGFGTSNITLPIGEADVTNLVTDLGNRELTANKGAASGYAPLDASSKVPTANLGSGTANATVFLRGDQSWATLTASAAWGSITGTLSSQTDLQNVLNAKLGYDFIGSNNITTLGTIVTGIWHGTSIDDTYITSAATWNGKLSSVTADSPLSGDGTSASHLIIATANTSTTGVLTSTDWDTFNNKQDALGYTPADNATLGQPSGIAVLDASSYVPTANLGSGTANATSFLRGDQSWVTIAGGGDMLKSTYDPNDDGVIASAQLDTGLFLTSGVRPLEAYIDIPTIAIPATPSAGFMRLYVEDFKGFPFFSFSDNTGMVRKIVRDSVFVGKNITGTTLPAYSAVYASGNADGVPTLALAKSDNMSTLPAVGITIEAVDNGTFGRVMQVGLVENVDTTAWAAGTVLYVSETVPGGYTDTPPVYPYFTQEIGTILVSDAVIGSVQVIARSVTHTHANMNTLNNIEESFTTALKNNYDTAYGWGNHASAGYLTSANLSGYLTYAFTGSSNITTLGTIGTGKWQGDKIADAYIDSATTWNAKLSNVNSGVATNINGILSGNGSAVIIAPNNTALVGTQESFTTASKSNYDTAYGWGNHATQGYLTSANLSGYLTYAFVGSSNITTLGTIGTGTWNGNLITGTYGGTGVNNGSKTITLGGAFTTSGTFNTTLTVTDNTSVTLPTTGTLVNSAVTTLSSLASVGTITTGTWNGTLISPTFGGTGVNNGSKTITLGGNLSTNGGAYNLNLNLAGTTNVTLPTSGTLIATRIVYIICIDPTTALATGTGKAYFTVPIELNGMNLVAVAASVYTVSSSGLPTFGIFNNTDSTNMCSTNITIDANGLTSYTANTTAVIDTAKDDVVTGDQIRLDCNVAGTSTKGMDIKMTFGMP